MSDARLLAIKSLLEIFKKGKRPKQSLEYIAASLDRRDRSFHMEIVYGVLRYRDTIDWILNHFLENPSKLGDFTLNNLRIAVYQIFFMRVPDWAVVNESVDIEKDKTLRDAPRRKAPLVNAVLRNILRQKEEFALPLQLDDPVESVAVNTSHPKWLVERWFERYGKDEALMLARANNEIQPFSIRANTLRVSRDELLRKLAEHGVESEPARFSPDGITLRKMHTYADLSFIHGLFAVQDEASQLIAYLLDPRPGERVLDACAAPGGKTSHIAQIMRDNGEIIAVEMDPKRIVTLKENLQVLGAGSAKIINADINSMHETEMGAFDRILLDAPCSSIGVIRKNPDVKYKYTAADLTRNRGRQLALLKTVSRFLGEKGRLVYSVCSIEPEEGEQVIREFLKTAGDFRIIEEVRHDFLHPFMEKGFFKTYPHKYTMDGFFGVALCRNR
ncbi:MAG: 16S rRNA (cytosine(967)-C(5))-methyltransferase RsmB [Nitrospirota bacterium]|nr:16S rRNA (cytosine(967)-C(5))-methyltransferase RsmB [Nitrospirota bacterium]